ncbi:hypothetical protein HMPREF9440_02476 [Sutterella parvirubra YIT 11816]|uniref:Uncharacterized protein n=1 Tax=Sutterella parvirubra YIT 11816 TaxID=762967 RepID=H3KI74_9BURK|nr:hypothetical protein HMPREF9440_02476 [Sutterella parvirubra YIT 11816]
MYERLTNIFSAAAIRIVGAADAAHTHPHDVTDLLRCGFCGALGDDPKPERSTPHALRLGRGRSEEALRGGRPRPLVRRPAARLRRRLARMPPPP